jgi:hypothetical protein
MNAATEFCKFEKAYALLTRSFFASSDGSVCFVESFVGSVSTIYTCFGTTCGRGKEGDFPVASIVLVLGLACRFLRIWVFRCFSASKFAVW